MNEDEQKPVCLEDKILSERQKTFGFWVKRKREELNLPISKIAEDLCIKPVYLQAIEDENWHLLPGYGYIIGFISSYACYLGLDRDKTIEKFKSGYSNQVPGLSKSEMSVIPKAYLFSKLPVFVIVLFTGLILITSLTGVISYWHSNKNHRQDMDTKYEMQPSSESKNRADLEAIKSKTHIVEEKNIPKNAQSLDHQIILKTRVDAWLEIKDLNKRIIYSKVLKSGEMFHFAGQKELYINVHNAGAFDIILKGKYVGRLGETGVPVSNKSIASIIHTALKNQES